MPRGRGGGRGRGRKGRWGRRMRVVEPMLLLLLARDPAHGYRLTERLGGDFGMATLPPQTVYRALQEMEAAGWISATWDVDSGQGPPRKIYQVTPEGQAALDAWADEMLELRQMLDAFLESYRDYQQQVR